MSEYQIGQKLRLTKTINDEATGDSPGCFCGHKGDIVFVRKIYEPPFSFIVSVSHESRLDSSFGVTADEIEVAE